MKSSKSAMYLNSNQPHFTCSVGSEYHIGWLRMRRRDPHHPYLRSASPCSGLGMTSIDVSEVKDILSHLSFPLRSTSEPQFAILSH